MPLIRTFMLLAAMTALFGFVGFLLGGQGGMMIALGMACVTNLFAYWNSDKMVLRMYRAQPLSPSEQPELSDMVRQLAANAEIPEPKAYLLPSDQPNAFATGRNPEHGAVAVTHGLLRLLDRRELAGVVAHELAHIKNRDTLTMTITATIAGAISMLANFGMFFGGGRHGRMGPIAGIAMAVLAPLAAALVQMAISRTREYEADRVGAEICGDPLGLASALEKIAGGAARLPNDDAEDNPATAHLFIMNPLHERAIDGLFSTHPNPTNRIRRLQAMAEAENNGGEPKAYTTLSPRKRIRNPWARQRRG